MQQLTLFQHMLPAMAEAMKLNNKHPLEPKPAETPQPPQKFHKGGKGKGERKGKGHQRSKNGSTQMAVDSDQKLRESIQLMAVMCLRLSDQVNLLLLDRGFILYCKVQAPESLLSNLFAISQSWKAAREEGKTVASLRVTLWQCLFSELLARVRKLDQDVALVKKTIATGWISKQEGQEVMWKYMQWDPQSKSEKVMPERGPLPQSDVVEALQTIVNTATGETLQRFHSIKPQAETYTTEQVQFLVEVSNRGDHAQKLHEALCIICQSTVMNFVGCKLRRERIKRNAAATRLSQMLGRTPRDQSTVDLSA